jgi:Family of unknown function (DUF5989)
LGLLGEQLLDPTNTPRTRAGKHAKPILRENMSFLAELWMFVRVRKKFWLLPILIGLLLFGGLIVLTKGSAVAPFIYTLF